MSIKIEYNNNNEKDDFMTTFYAEYIIRGSNRKCIIKASNKG